MVEFLNKLLACFVVAEYKYHSMHTDMQGNLYLLAHPLFGDVYSFFWDKKDQLKERIVQLWGKSYSSLKNVISASTIAEIDSVGSMVECFNSLKKDLESLSDMLRTWKKECGEDLETQQLLIDYSLQIGTFLMKVNGTLSAKN